MQEHRREVDTAEPWSLQEALIQTGWERKRLYSGDFKFFGYNFLKVGVTRKTVSDLLSSITGRNIEGEPKRRSKTFAQELEEMVDAYEVKIIIIEGSWRTVGPSQRLVSTRGMEHYTWSMVWNFLRSWQDRGFTLELTTNEGHTVKRLNELYAYYSKPVHSGGLNRRTVGDPRLLAFPPTVGPKTGEKVLEQFGSLRAVANATLTELLTVEDVGPKRGESILLHFLRDGRTRASDTNR